MKTLSVWRDLEEFGIDALTGEACGLGFRLLCDVTDAGKKIICKALGVESIQFAGNWNSGTEAAPHTGSVMFAPEVFSLLAGFALLENGYAEAWQVGGGVIGFKADDPDRVDLELLYAKERTRVYRYRGTAGDRNLHVMSGRVR